MLSAYAIELFLDNKKVTAKAINSCSDYILSGDPGGIRTPDPRLRRPLLYPTELLNHDNYIQLDTDKKMERVKGIEPS